jgi:hypothetical protein
MSPQPDTNEQALASAVQLTQMLAHAHFQLIARFDALKAIVCELHPEVATRLEARIQQESLATAKQFETLLQSIEFLRSKISGPTQ